MRSNGLLRLVLVLCIVMIPFTVSGIFASWVYFSNLEPIDEDIDADIGRFVYGDIYITKVERAETSVENVNAVLEKISTTTVAGNIDLGKNSDASAIFNVTFYNGSDTIYYYHEAETLTSSNSNIAYEVDGIVKKDAVEPGTYKTITVTYSYNDKGNLTITTLDSSVLFKFVVDKESIEIVVARTAVDRFRDILNNVAFDDSYDMLDTAMDERAGWNHSSDVTYIGNVSGSTSDNSMTIQTLFGEEFMSMDLDGDGTSEPITMMIKRENLDNNLYTGTTYEYIYRNRQYQVDGVEMTLYITAQNLNNVGRGDSVVVYAATFTVYAGENEWVEVVPLTKGTASANNYSGSLWGEANSFNTDTWKSDTGKTMEELVLQYIN